MDYSIGMVENEFWRAPFVISIFCGDNKPTSAAEFLEVCECLELESNVL